MEINGLQFLSISLSRSGKNFTTLKQTGQLCSDSEVVVRVMHLYSEI